jgi:NADH:ubiquinone oxidoreductase subunit
MVLSRIKQYLFPTWPRRVGSDLTGNTYYLVREAKNAVDKRIIKYKGEFPEPETVPMVWHAWLRYARDTPPTIDEIHAENQKREEILRRARLLKEADDKLREQEIAERRLKQTGENDHV